MIIITPFSLNTFSRHINKKQQEFFTKLKDTSLSLTHIYGEYIELDFARTKLQTIDTNSQVVFYIIFVATWSASGYTHTYLLKSKNQQETFNAILYTLKEFACLPKYFKVDKAKIFIKHTKKKLYIMKTF